MKEGLYMRKMPLLFALSVGFSTLALAENWSGNLLDASCYDKQKSAESCDATSTTTAFALNVSGTIYKLDPSGNSKASTALKNRADRSDPAKPQSTTVAAKVVGTEKSGMIAVENIEVQ
jgi:hypothetical protein